MKVGQEEDGGRHHHDERTDRRKRLRLVDRRTRHAAEAQGHRHGTEHGLQGQEVHAPQQPDQDACQEFRSDIDQDYRGDLGRDAGLNLLEKDRRQRQTCGKAYEEPHLNRNPITRESRSDHQASTNPAEDQEDPQQKIRGYLVHEMVPSELTSTPRAISRCDRTGKEENMRSMIIRT